MAQCPLKKDQQSSELSLPDWLSFLKPQQGEEDPFRVKSPNLLTLVDKKEPHVITGTHNHGNQNYIGTRNQNLVKDLSPSNHTSSRVVKHSSSKNDTNKMMQEKRTGNKDSENPNGTWSIWLIVLLVLWSCSLLLPVPSPQEWKRSLIVPSPSSHPKPASTRDGKTTSSTSTATTTTTTGPTNFTMPQRIATIILQELSPFPSPSDQDMTPIVDSFWKSGDTEGTESPPLDDTSIVQPTRKHFLQESDKPLLEQNKITDACDHSWQWILHRSCRVQRRQQESSTIQGSSTTTATTTPIAVDQSLIEPCLHWWSRDCRVQKRAVTGSSSFSRRASCVGNSFLESPSRDSSSSEPMFKEQTVKAVQSLLEAAYQTHKLMNLWIQEELETSNLVKPRNVDDE